MCLSGIKVQLPHLSYHSASSSRMNIWVCYYTPTAGIKLKNVHFFAFIYLYKKLVLDARSDRRHYKVTIIVLV